MRLARCSRPSAAMVAQRAVDGGDAHGKGEAHGRSPVVWSRAADAPRSAELAAALEDSIARDGGLPQRDAAVVDRHEAGGEHLEAVAPRARRSHRSGEQPVLEDAAGERDGRQAGRRRATRRQTSSTSAATVACSRAPTAPGAAPASRSSSTPANSGARRTTAGAGPSDRGSPAARRRDPVGGAAAARPAGRRAERRRRASHGYGLAAAHGRPRRHHLELDRRLPLVGDRRAHAGRARRPRRTGGRSSS